jgi:curved DNA-binding protein CbpA
MRRIVFVDPYAILGVAPEEPAGAVRKRFWKASLLVHPDKCSHKDAGAAFDALKKAAETLMNVEARARLDAARMQRVEDDLNQQVINELERERQWRLAQGIATEEDKRCPFCCIVLVVTYPSIFLGL